MVSGDEPAVLVRAAEPTFALVLQQDQAANVPAGAAVDVVFGEVTWPAVVAGTEVDDDGTYEISLTAPDGTLVCGADCARLPPEPSITLRADIHVVPEAHGPGVPAAAVRTDASGSTYVVDAEGEDVPVTVRATGDGIAVVDGLVVGDRVVVVGGAAPVTGGDVAPELPSAERP